MRSRAISWRRPRSLSRRSRPEPTHPLQEAVETRDAAPRNQPGGQRSHRGPRGDGRAPAGEDVGAREERHDPEENAEVQQPGGRRERAREGLDDHEAQGVRERAHRQHGRPLAGLEPAVQERGREGGLEAPDDVQRHLEQGRAGKLSRAIHAEKRGRRHEDQEGERPEFAEDPRDRPRKRGPDRRDEEEAADRNRDRGFGEAQRLEVERPEHGHHVERDAEEHLDSDQQGDALPSTHDPQACTSCSTYVDSGVRSTFGSRNVTATPTAPRFRMAPTKSVSRRSPTTPTNTPPTKAPATFERSWIIVTRPMYRGNSVSWPASSNTSYRYAEVPNDEAVWYA